MSDQEQEPIESTAEPVAEPEPETTAEPAPAVAPETGPRRLTRSRDDRVIAGVCGGLGEYFGVDAVLIRIAALVLVFAGGAGLLLYAIGWIAMPEHPETGVPGPLQAPGAVGQPSERTGGALALGLLFIALGAFFLVDEIWSDFLDWQYLWPIVLIAVGAAVLVRARQ
jgi:phage shock protein PspC (stress-responsive transcriptional regulator)